jgi:hypothetical protein
MLGRIACKTQVLYFEKLGSCRERTGEIDDGFSYNGSQPPSALMHGQPFCGAVCGSLISVYFLATDCSLTTVAYSIYPTSCSAAVRGEAYVYRFHLGNHGVNGAISAASILLVLSA